MSVGLDHTLIFEARKLISGANIHSPVETWLFCYQTSLPDSPKRKRYEDLLRDFVRMQRRMLFAFAQAEAARSRFPWGVSS